MNFVTDSIQGRKNDWAKKLNRKRNEFVGLAKPEREKCCQAAVKYRMGGFVGAWYL